VRALLLACAAAALIAGDGVVIGSAGTNVPALPTASNTRLLLEGAVHTSEFVDATVGRDEVHAYVSYPDRADKAPALVITTDEGMSDWARALGYTASRAGFIAVVPDTVTGGTSPDAVHRFVTDIPAANGTIATIDVRAGRIVVALARHSAVAPGHHPASPEASAASAEFARDDRGWADALAFLAHQTGNHYSMPAQADHVAMEMRASVPAAAGRALSEPERMEAAGGQALRLGSGQALRPGSGQALRPGSGQAGPRQAPGLNVKTEDLPANWVMADKVANTTPRRNEWVDVPVPGTPVKVRTWVVYPEGTQTAGAVLVLHGASGLTDWVRAVADQLAQDGFIALAVDLSSGLGPDGGNYDSFRFMDDRMRATQKLARPDVMARIVAVRNYAATMPRSNGRTGSIGFCGGGTNSFALATEVPSHGASVVYYGAAPPAAALAKVNAPVLGFYGEDDARIVATVEPTRAEMKRLGKAYEAHTYAHATHSFLWMQDLGDNFAATSDAWPRTITFFRQHLSGAGASAR
jgi:carboxymethylenebutenolidase